MIPISLSLVKFTFSTRQVIFLFKVTAEITNSLNQKAEVIGYYVRTKIGITLDQAKLP